MERKSISHTPRRIDHVVVAVRDLDAAGAFYQQLGFRVGARNHHPWGTENRLIQFSSSFIELIAVGSHADAMPRHQPGQFSFGGFVREYLSQREGLAMLALESANAKADGALFASKGVGAFEPFSFSRNGRRPDGSETHVAFTLAFAVDPRAPQAGFFVCQQHFPENFWNSAFQRHDNRASGIAEVGMIAGHPYMYRDFLSIFTGSPIQQSRRGRLSIDLDGSRLTVSSAAGSDDLQLNSLVFALLDPSTQATRLRKAGIPFAPIAQGLRIPPETAFGLSLLFKRTADSR